MNTYPVLKQARESKEAGSTGRQIDRASNGAVKARSFYTSVKKTFNLVHPGIADADKAAHQAFEAANRNIPFLFVWDADGATYTCLFGEGAPSYVPIAGGRWDIAVQLVEA
jgi:hypothetical protein